jgi:hypothetical protein
VHHTNRQGFFVTPLAAQLFVPTARAEFRLYEFKPTDVPYFVRRRSEEQARSTKNYLERKWGVEWPNTGFCSYIKFSILRHKHFHAAEGVGDAVLPTEWAAQAGLVVGFFERNGLNRHGAAVQNGAITVRRHLRHTSTAWRGACAIA